MNPRLLADVLSLIPVGSLRSYAWVASQIRAPKASPDRTAQRWIAREMIRRWATPEAEAVDQSPDFPWWRVVGVQGEVVPAVYTGAWFARHVCRLEAERHILLPITHPPFGLRVSPLPADFA